MARELQVFAINLDGRHRGIVAAKSKTEALRCFGFPKTQSNYLSITGNEIELQTALAEPGVVFVTKHFEKNYKRVEPGKSYTSGL